MLYQLQKNLGSVYYAAVTNVVKSAKSNIRKLCQRWTNVEKYGIGKYAAENGYAAAARKFKENNFNESTTKGICQTVQGRAENSN